MLQLLDGNALFSIIYGIILPIDYIICFKMVNTTNQYGSIESAPASPSPQSSKVQEVDGHANGCDNWQKKR
jgi:hypothetical protein